MQLIKNLEKIVTSPLIIIYLYSQILDILSLLSLALFKYWCKLVLISSYLLMVY